MKISQVLCAWLVIAGLTALHAQAAWLVFAGGPVVSVGNWPGGSALTGPVTATASGFINGNIATPAIGLTPITVGPPLSADYIATTLQPNPGPTVSSIGTPYNDTGDKYHVSIDFSAVIGGPNPGVLPAGSIFAILDLDITENYRKVSATNAANLPIVTPWIAGPNGYFDMTNPMLNQFTLIPNPTLAGPVLGVYEMFGVAYNFDVGMWLFQTTQDVRTISFDMEVGVGGNNIGGGGATLAFYSPPVPEPATTVFLAVGIAGAIALNQRRRN